MSYQHWKHSMFRKRLDLSNIHIVNSSIKTHEVHRIAISGCWASYCLVVVVIVVVVVYSSTFIHIYSCFKSNTKHCTSSRLNVTILQTSLEYFNRFLPVLYSCGPREIQFLQVSAKIIQFITKKIINKMP